MSAHAGSPRSRHFQLERLAEGVYAEVHVDGGWGISNAGIVDLGKQTLVFDTGLTPQAACDLRSAAELLTGRTPDYVVNSHHHNDHIRGNQAFPEAVVVSTARTLELIASQGHDDIDADRKQAPESLAEMKTLAESQDAESRGLATVWLPYWEGILASLSELQLRLPELTFKDQLTFHGKARASQLLATSGGHTEGDCVLFFAPGTGGVLWRPLVCAMPPVPWGLRPRGLSFHLGSAQRIGG